MDPLDPPAAVKRLGQNFLIDPNIIRKIVALAEVGANDDVLEIGPGEGAITRPLLAACKHVVAFEIDRDLAAALRAEGHERLTIVEGDVLGLSAAQLLAQIETLGFGGLPLRLAGNLPYNVASPILFRLLGWFEAGVPIVDTTVMLQREVAERLLAPVGTAEYGVLSVLLRHVATIDRRLKLPPGAFRPAPEVHSTVVTLRWQSPTPPPRDLALFRSVVRAVFTRRRKTLANALAAWGGRLMVPTADVLSRAGLNPGLRPEALDIPQFVQLADAVTNAAQAEHGAPNPVADGPSGA